MPSPIFFFKKILIAVITVQKCVLSFEHIAYLFVLLAQKNKATSYHLGQLKAKLAKLKRELIGPSSGSGGGGGGIGFDVAR